jgi:MFS family permease
MTTITGRHPRRPVIATGMLLTGAGFALTALATDVPLLAVTVAIWTIGEIAAAPVAQAYVAELAPLHLRGRYQGAFGLTFALGLVFAPALGTAAYAANATAFWLSCGVLGVASALLVVGIAPHRRAA